MFSRPAGLSNPSCVTAAAFSSPNPDRQKHQKIRRPRQRRRHLNMMRGALGSIIVPAPQKCREIGGPTLCLARVRTRIASRSNEVKRVLIMATSLQARAMLTLAYGCGLRAGEVMRLRAGDIDSEQMIIRVVQSKGLKDRHVMLPAEVLDLLRQWWKARPTAYDTGLAPEQRWLFPGRSKRRPLTTRQFARLFKQAAKAAGLRKTLSLHTLRHSFATHLLERGTDIRVIQALLGHEKLETTARYTRVATGLISKIESPLDGLSGPRRRRARRDTEEPPTP